MNVSVVIPARNEEKNLPRCLAALARQTYGDFELIVVDSASTDGTGRIARDHGARVIKVEVPGVALARQVGFEAAQGEIITSMDADTIAPPDWLARLIAPLSDPQVVETVGGLVYEGQNLIPSIIDSVWQRTSHKLGLTTATAAVPSHEAESTTMSSKSIVCFFKAARHLGRSSSSLWAGTTTEIVLGVVISSSRQRSP